MVSGDGLKTPGELLQEARNAHSMTIEQLAGITKIPERMLSAIEMDEYHKLSGQLYVSSFLRTFAEAVGVDADEVLELHKKHSGAMTTDATTEVIWDEDDVKVKKVAPGDAKLILRGLVLVVVLALVAVVVWMVFLRDSDQAGDTEDASSAPMQTLLAQTDENPSAEVDPQQEITAPATNPGDMVEPTPLERLSADSLAIDWDGSDPSVQEPAPAAESVEPPVLPVAHSGGPDLLFGDDQTYELVLRLICGGRCQTSVRCDGDASQQAVRWPDTRDIISLPDDAIEPGRPYAVQGGYAIYWGAADHFYLQLADVADVEITLNGVPQNIDDFRFGGEVLLDTDSLDSRSTP